MTDFRQITPEFLASPQITPEDVAEAARLGCTLIVNNRPEGEAQDQPAGSVIESAAKDAGLSYLAIPITHAGFSEPQVAALDEALSNASGPVLAYCRSGTRSTLLWALAQARTGQDPAWIAEHAAAAGYDVAPIAPMIDFYAGQARSA